MVEIAWGEVRGMEQEFGREKPLEIGWESFAGRERAWSMEHGRGKGQETVENSKCKKLLARLFQDKFHQCHCPEKLCAQDLSNGFKTLCDGTCMAKSSWLEFFHFARRSDPHFFL